MQAADNKRWEKDFEREDRRVKSVNRVKLEGVNMGHNLSVKVEMEKRWQQSGTDEEEWEKATEREIERAGVRETERPRERKIFPRPHDLHVGVVFSSEEEVAAVRPHHVLVHRELDLPPELTVLLRGHGQPA